MEEYALLLLSLRSKYIIGVTMRVFSPSYLAHLVISIIVIIIILHVDFSQLFSLLDVGIRPDLQDLDVQHSPQYPS